MFDSFKRGIAYCAAVASVGGTALLADSLATTYIQSKQTVAQEDAPSPSAGYSSALRGLLRKLN